MSRINGSGLEVGVIGVGSMGQHHARIYDELAAADLVGVFDADDEQAAVIAEKHDTKAMEIDELLNDVAAVSIAVPTQFHCDIAKKCLKSGVAPLIEKPVATTPDEGRELKKFASIADVPVQVGHVERFNPTVEVLQDIVEDLDVLAVNAERLGPPPQRSIDDSAILDLMIHDIDVVLSLIDGVPVDVTGVGIRNNRYGTATIKFDSGIVASLTASRLTQRKLRKLVITAENCVVEVDYIEQSIEIHRQSMPSYVEKKEGLRYRHESIIERPTVPSGEPLKKQLNSFLESVVTNSTPQVTLDDSIRSLEIAMEIEEDALGESQTIVPNDI